jgi:hypothetical protein
VGVCRGDDQLANPGGCAERDRARDQAAEAEAEQIGLGDPQLVQQRDDVPGQRLDRHRAAGVGGVPVALELHRDHLPARRKGLEQRPEIEVDGQQATVEQDKWPTGTVRLVVQLQAVHRCGRHAGYDGTRAAYSSPSPAHAAHRSVVVTADATLSDPRRAVRGEGRRTSGNLSINRRGTAARLAARQHGQHQALPSQQGHS